MTNKLRSVIDELHYNSTTMTVDPDSPRVVYYKDAVKTVLKTLDAIIEEMEKCLSILFYKAINFLPYLPIKKMKRKDIVIGQKYIVRHSYVNANDEAEEAIILAKGWFYITVQEIGGNHVWDIEYSDVYYPSTTSPL